MGTCGGTRQASCGWGDVRQTLAVADSMRVNHGVAYDDSLALAEAVAMVDTWWHRTFHPADYAKANYYYGRLLRNRGDQPAAMLAFLRAVHTDPDYPARAIRAGLPFRTVSSDEYSMLGRVYSNIGSMCHLAEKYDTSREMYLQSSQQFLLANDSLNYLYARYEAAYELAESARKDEAIDELEQIEADCNAPSVLGLVYLAKAQAYMQCKDYDSTLYYANQEQRYYPHENTGVLIKAQAFSLMGDKDSAIYYANLLINSNAGLETKQKAYYILQHDDVDNISKDSINILSADRTDVHNALDKRHQQLAQAVQLLNLDISYTPSRKQIVLLVISLMVIGGVVLLCVIGIRRWSKWQHANIEKERVLAQTEVQKARQEQQIIRAEHSAYYDQLRVEIENNCKLLRKMQNIETELAWEQHQHVCEMADKHFHLLANKLRALDVLNEREIHLCILVMIGGFSDKQLANMLSYGTNSIRSIKLKTANKLGTTSSNLREFLIEKAVHGIEKLP